MSKVKVGPFTEEVDGKMKSYPRGLSTNPADLAGPRQYAVERFTPVKHTRLLMQVEAANSEAARRTADEIVYAAAWVERTYPDQSHKTAPEQWAEVEAKKILKGAK